MRFPHWRKATWALIVWGVLILLWIISAFTGADCGNDAKYSDQTACEAGGAIAVVLILGVGFLGFVFFALIWLMSRPKRRVCPQCGADVAKGLTACHSCGHSFAQPQPVAAAVLPVAAAGWYAEPGRAAGRQRYWDGQAWTDQCRDSGSQ